MENSFIKYGEIFAVGCIIILAYLFHYSETKETEIHSLKKEIAIIKSDIEFIETNMEDVEVCLSGIIFTNEKR
jgi:hypothetical protein